MLSWIEKQAQDRIWETTFLGMVQRTESNKRGRVESMGKENQWKPMKESEGRSGKNFKFLQDVR